MIQICKLALLLSFMFHALLKKIFFVGLILLSWEQLCAQSPVYKNYTVEDGLPSSEVYSAFQDSKGYMWFATDAGVSRFNGYEFENFDASDGLTDNTVFLITEDHKGRVWFGTFNCQLSYYENDSIYPYRYNRKIPEVIKEKAAIVSFHVDVYENIWLGSSSTGLYRIDKFGVIENVVETPNKDYGYSKLFVIDNKS